MDPKCIKMLTFLQLVVVFSIHNTVTAAQSKLPEQELVKRLFDTSQYDRRVRPVDNTGGPVIVTVNMFLRSVSKLDEINNEVNVQLTYRQKWRDERLSFRAGGDIKNLNLINPENLIWRPDTFFSNEKEGNYHNLMVRNEFARLSPNGQILHSSRISLKLSCPMNFKNFPFDRQTCPIRFASYGYTTKDLKLVWEEHTPVQLMPNLNLLTHNLEGIVTVSCDSTTTTGNYSCLRADFTFKRLFTPYLLNVYIPGMMMFIVSWLSFWIDVRAMTARMVLLITTLLVLAVSTAEINKTFPPAGYTKAVDVWTGVCLTFVLGALVEFIIVQNISRREGQKALSSSNSKNNIGSGVEDSIQRTGDEEQEIPLKDTSPSMDGKEQNQNVGKVAILKQRAIEVTQKYVSRFDSLPEKIDGVSRVAFPAAFAIFTILYWPVYSLSS